jgi:hypothetical protein
VVAERLLASSGSALSNILLFSAVILGWPGLGPLDWGGKGGHPAPWFVQSFLFEPFIDNPVDYEAEPDWGARCPGPVAREESFELSEAPLPAIFDPLAYPRDKLFACVRLASGAEIREVRLLDVPGLALPRSLVRTIRREWRFVPGIVEPDDGGWVRVRLNAGPMDVAMPGYRE